MTKTAPELIEKYVFDECNFKDVNAFEEYIRENGTSKADLIAVDGLLYTMHEFDHDGVYIQWVNKRTGAMIEAITSNRYGTLGFKDAKIEYYPDYGIWRNDINYKD